MEDPFYWKMDSLRHVWIIEIFIPQEKSYDLAYYFRLSSVLMLLKAIWKSLDIAADQFGVVSFLKAVEFQRFTMNNNFFNILFSLKDTFDVHLSFLHLSPKLAKSWSQSIEEIFKGFCFFNWIALGQCQYSFDFFLIEEEKYFKFSFK